VYAYLFRDEPAALEATRLVRRSAVVWLDDQEKFLRS
jgi:hypothetical protein